MKKYGKYMAIVYFHPIVIMTAVKYTVTHFRAILLLYDMQV